jgi:hypothetical protein
MVNLINTVAAPTRITSNNKLLLNVIVINKESHTNPGTVVDLGFSDHQAQIFWTAAENPKNAPVKVRKRQFTEKGIKEFKYLLLKESWQEVLLNSEVNTKFNVFMDIVLFYFGIVSPIKLFYVREANINGWIA